VGKQTLPGEAIGRGGGGREREREQTGQSKEVDEVRTRDGANM
jgi:hypothetical protein